MSERAGAERPNILVLMSDQHSKRQLDCYGDSLVRTPNLDRLASEGMLFENAYCPSPVCVPSRMSFMTGRTPTGNRVWTNQNVLHSGIPTWAHSLGIAGYETALIGRMHFVGSDQRHGFEKRPLGEYMATHPGGPMLGEPMFRDIPQDTTSQHRVSVEMAGVGLTSYNAFDDMVTDGLVEYLDEKASCEGRPFAAVAGFMMPHCPFFAPEELFSSRRRSCSTTTSTRSTCLCRRRKSLKRNHRPSRT
ncbi:MAG: sulfatase-like hydrolase/transferase [Dehalococcoidia bacterium]|nr:sulfatase-like hydrolase/transferase [Dehalococcoidia bacterium]